MALLPTEIPVATIRARDALPLAATPERVFAVLADLPRWERWWPWLVRVTPVALDARLVGSVLAMDPIGAPAFRCRVEAADPPHRLRLRYVDGPYAGTGDWRIAPDPAGARVTYEVDLTTTHPLLQPIGRMLDLGALHSLLMQEVLRGLAREVEGAGGAGTAGAR